MKPWSPSLRLSGRDFQPLLSPEPLAPLVIDLPPFPTEYCRDPSVSVSALWGGQIHDLGHPSGLIIADMPFPSLGRPTLPQHSTGPTFGNSLCS